MLAAIFAAADAQVRTAGALLAGDHTIRDSEPKYGLAVVATAHPDAIWTKSEARPGDALALAYDPQTVGGLLVALPREKAAALEAEFEAKKLFVRRIGSVADGAGVVVV